uniref:Autophagy-related protein 11 C-terminal domain-containing protein n=2 Tax=Ditylum brightwellii TaxID=49249 RepID=A0A7S4VY14_9STRA
MLSNNAPITQDTNIPPAPNTTPSLTTTSTTHTTNTTRTRTTMSSSQQTSIIIRVLAASTGVCYRINLHPNELTVANIRRHLAGAIPPSDQILLLGPPYKVPKDSTLRSAEVLSALRLGDQEDDIAVASPPPDGTTSAAPCLLNATERTGSKRLFLFSKRALSEAAPDPPPCILDPQTIHLPTEPDPSPVPFRSAALSDSSAVHSPLHQALEVYERRFMLHLCRGRALTDGADLRLTSCRACVAEQVVIARALRAAVSNLSDHRNGAARTRSEFTANFQTKTAQHAVLLGKFDGYLDRLAKLPLDPALVSVARSSGRIMETLLDTVPVEREKQWAAQCKTSHENLMGLFAEVDTGFAQLTNAQSREEEARQDLQAEEEIKALSTEVESIATGIRNKQAERLHTLTKDHRDVVTTVMGVIHDESAAQAAFSTLENMSKASSSILPSMEADDEILAQLMQKVANAKTTAMKRMRTRLRQVSTAQSSIQRVLSSVAVVRDALSQQCENMVHLEHVAELPASYRDFLAEIRRRRAYGGAVASSSSAMMERLATMRADEVKARERFLRNSGRHLMPPFFDIFAPTLTTPPPLYTPQLPAMVEMDSLPDIKTLDSGGSEAAAASGRMGSSSLDENSDAPVQGGHITTDKVGVSSTSSLTDPQQQQQPENEEGARGSSRAVGQNPTDGTQGGNAQNDHSLIVSADEQSANDVIMEDDEGGLHAEAEAERKTMAYENATLRQALERLGGKSPRVYVEEARERDREAEEKRNRRRNSQKASSADDERDALKSQVISLEKQLEEAKAQAKKATDALVESNKKSDKISHSSFHVGDVGLFMPTGRGSDGKRTYLAFHSNCPHRYLSTDSIKGTPDYVLGRIVYQEELIASGSSGTDSNPYGLHPGTKFWVLTVEVIKVP